MSLSFHYPDRRAREQGRRAAVAAVLGLWLVAPQAETLPYQADPQHTRVHWEVGHFGTSTHRGRFDRLDTQLRYDRATGLGEVSVTVDTTSVTSGVPVLDGILRGEYFFASDKYPKAYFVSRRFQADADGRLVALDGELTIRDISMPFRLTARHFGCYPHPVLKRDVCGGDFEGRLKRSDFGMTYAWPVVDDTVRLIVQVEAVAP